MSQKTSVNKSVAIFLVIAIGIRFFLLNWLEASDSVIVQLGLAVAILAAGAFLVLKKAADVIEETTEVLSERTQIASGVLQSLGTAFPDMALGVVAAVISLQVRSTDLQASINYAIIAAATTFGSNIYNISHAAWCIYRQNVANQTAKAVLMFPKFPRLGTVKPLNDHTAPIHGKELQYAMDAVSLLTLLTAVVSIAMVLFGRITNPLLTENGDMYQLIRPVGVVIGILCLAALFYFRKNHREPATVTEIENTENRMAKTPGVQLFLALLFSGVAILFAAESMIKAIEIFSNITHIPLVIAGVLSGLVGCLGEMIVVHDFSVHPNGRLGDAIMGVAMDNIVTTLGAAIVAVMGGIFLGGRSLIIIFVLILAFNTTLLWQIGKLQPFIKQKYAGA